MANDTSLAARIRNLIGPAIVVAALATGTVLVGPEVSETQEIRIAAFNIQVFGKAKRGNAEVMDVLVEVAQSFDVMAVQEVRDASETTADVFLEAINASSEFTYAMYEGPRVGRSRSKEQYVLYYVPAIVQLQHAYTIPDEDDLFEREPLVATFTAGNFDFTLVVCHIKPDDAEAELRALESIVPAILEANPDEEDIILLGDFNADGRYLNESELPGIFGPSTYQVIITDGRDTMTTSDNTYDRIILMNATSGWEYIEGSGDVFQFDWVFALDDEEFVKSVSDHYPVYADFRLDLPDDDGP